MSLSVREEIVLGDMVGPEGVMADVEEEAAEEYVKWTILGRLEVVVVSGVSQ
jgi:hypothetical protein